MKNTKQTNVANALSSLALSSLALSALAGGFPGNPEHNVIDESVGTSIVAASVNDGWKDFDAERTQYVGGGSPTPGGGHIYTKEDMLQARMDYRASAN